MPHASFNRAVDPALRAIATCVDIVLPRRCLACNEFVNAADGLCPRCWSEIRFLRSIPSEDEAETTPVNGLDGSRSALLYDGASRHLILGFKHGGRIEGVGLFARWMIEAGREVLAEADIILPVPLHRWRLLRRGFNQCSLLAHRISRLTGVPAPENVLVRTRQTRSQQGLNARARRSNITPESFALSAKRAHLVQDARIVLIDDVLTTGATLESCAQVLKQHGARSVTALTLARTGHGADMD